MKGPFASLIILCSVFTVRAFAESVEVFNPSTGRFSFFDTERSRGGTIEVFNITNGQIMIIELDASGQAYDVKNNKFYDVDMDRNGKSGRLFDFQDGKIYDFTID